MSTILDGTVHLYLLTIFMHNHNNKSKVEQFLHSIASCFLNFLYSSINSPCRNKPVFPPHCRVSIFIIRMKIYYGQFLSDRMVWVNMYCIFVLYEANVLRNTCCSRIDKQPTKHSISFSCCLIHHVIIIPLLYLPISCWVVALLNYSSKNLDWRGGGGGGCEVK